MSDDELEQIKAKKLAEMMKKQQELTNLYETGVMELDSSNFEQTVSKKIQT